MGAPMIQVPQVGIIARETRGERFRESSAPFVLQVAAVQSGMQSPSLHVIPPQIKKLWAVAIALKVV